MRLTLYVVHGSHPCAAVEKALQLKGLEYHTIEWPPPFHAPIQLVLFGARTVPGLKLADDGTVEKISGSRAIMRRLERLAPEPHLFPADPDELRRVEEAERWGDEVFQPIARELIWDAFKHTPDAMVSYTEGSKIPLPEGAVKLSAPVLARLGCALNSTNDDVARTDLGALPDQLDKIDAWIADGTIGDPEHPNAADLQIASTLRLMMTLDDVRPTIDSRPSGGLAMGLFPGIAGTMPAGSLPAA